MLKQDISRRRFLQIGALAAGATMLPMPVRWLGTATSHAFVNSPNLTKWFDVNGNSLPLRGLGGGKSTNTIQVLSGVNDPAFANTTLYEVTAAEFTDQLHPDLGPTLLWGYRDSTKPATEQTHLSGLVVAIRGTASRIRFTNTLPSKHILPCDTTLPGANQAQNRIAVHLHGGFIPWISDGGPFDWWTPSGVGGLSFQNGPGSFYDNIPGKPMVPGQADYYYPNDQSTRLMWYHDHAHGITRLNAYAGIATGYLMVDPAQEAKFTPGIVPPVTSVIPMVYQDKVFVDQNIATNDPSWAAVTKPEVQGAGSLWYDHVYDPAAFRLKKGRGILTPPNPSCIPEFFGDTMLLNGTVTPLVELEAKRYRFMLLNACNARFLNINLLEVAPGYEIKTDPTTLLPADQISMATGAPLAGTPTPPVTGPAIIQIGNEGGYLYKEVVHPNTVFFNPALPSVGNLLLGCAERADIIIDFSGMAGKEFIFYNDALGPFPGGPPSTDYFFGNPATPSATWGKSPDTRQITRFKIKAASVADPQPAGPIIPPAIMEPAPIIDPALLEAGPVAPPSGTRIINLTLNEDFDNYGRLRQLVGTTRPALIAKGFGLEYLTPVQPEEIIPQGEVNVWRIFNLTADTHPMHFHLQDCQVLSRQPFKLVAGRFTPTGTARGPEKSELGWKETVKMNPGEVTTVIFKWVQPAVPFTVPTSNRAIPLQMGPNVPVGTICNEFVWHCHILEHEEHDMMRPLIITGQTPQRPNIVPTAATVGAGSTTHFTVTVPSGVTFNVASDNLNITPSNVNAAGFDVVIPAPASAQTVVFTVTGSNGLKSTVSVTIA